MTTRFLLAILLAAISSCRSSESPLALVGTYQDLSNDHAVERLLDMYTEDARLDFGPMGVVEGKDRIRGIHNYDRALDTEMHLEHCRLAGRNVTCHVVERNDWLRTAGIERLVYTESVFTFDEDGHIEMVSAKPAPESLDSMGVALSRFGAWAREHAAEDYETLFREDGSFSYSYENGRKVLALLSRWRDSAPGVR